jgi:glycosyltransferase involved in cell wall biosynthesis
MERPKVSVLIPTYNRAQFLPECLDSVLSQTVPPAQVIVINDGSTDNTREVLEPYMGRIEYLEKENGGRSTALNLGLSRVRGDYVWTMDDDDVALPDALETHLKVLESDSTIGFTYAPGYVGRTRPRGGGIEILKLRPLPDVSEDEFFLRYLQGCFFFNGAMLARTACYAAVGGFDPGLIRCQDVEMMLRIARHFRGRKISKPTLIVRLHSGMRGSENDRFEAERWIAKSREYEVKIFGRLRNELELRDYLPATFKCRTLEPELKRRAYLERMCVEAGRGMFDDMLCDLQLALAQTGENSRLARAERRCVSRAMGYLQPGDKLLSDPQFAKSVRLSCRGRAGEDVMVEMARGLFWRAEDALQLRRYRFFVQITRGAWRLLRLRGSTLALMRKLREALDAHGPQGSHLRNRQAG